jgi:NhaP-type Na+/H+ or K+/H+ antiporter
MHLLPLAIIAGGLLLYSLVSGRLQGSVLTAPLIFIVFGYSLGAGGFDLAAVDVGHSTIHTIAEFTLILVLFTDAARIDLNRVRQDHDLPVRMLLVGLPLTIVAGAFFAAWLFPAFSIWEAALLAALLAPTDAALGQSVIAEKAVPVRIRQAINIESGLNDGMALPAVLLLAALVSAGSGAGAGHESAQAGDWVQFGLLQITLGPIAGIVIGYLGARCLDSAIERGWTSSAFQGIGILSLAGFTFLVAE